MLGISVIPGVLMFLAILPYGRLCPLVLESRATGWC
jgi:hypothetical protein